MKSPAPTFSFNDGLIDYKPAVSLMETHVKHMYEGCEGELIWGVEHPSLYTMGTSANAKDLLVKNDIPVFPTGRGGEITYHGPGQRIMYVMLDLRNRGQDIRKFIWQLEEWIIQTIADFNIQGERRENRIGIWVTRPDGTEAKIAAIGIRVRKWITYHGIAINIDPDLSYYQGIVPCGIKEYGVTSFQNLGHIVSMEEVDTALIKQFPKVF